jgi:hydrophobic/amphiphilic exporter-1 (mainly G- bacteria), HAE1 family
MGLTLTVGILVDDSIVVLENIFRHLQRGEDPKEAAVNGRSEIGFAAIAITLVDIVVFTPIAFMSGFVGQWFRQFGLVIATATVFSLFISFTLTPLLASRWYRRGQAVEVHTGGRTWNPLVWFARGWDAGYRRIESAYGGVLKTALRFRWLVVGLGVGSFVGGILLVTTGLLSTEFMPEEDNGEMVIQLEMPAGTTLDATNRAAELLEQKVMAWPEVESAFTSVGVGGGSAFLSSQTRFARIQVKLKERSERKRGPAQLVAEARTFGSAIPGATVKGSVISFVGGGQAPISVRVQGEDQRVLTQLATQVANAVRSVPGTSDVSDGGVTGQPELVVHIDRERAADLGLTPGQVASVLRTGIAGSAVSTFRPAGTKGWDVTVILDPNDRARGEQVTEIPIVTPRGSVIRLGQIAEVTTVSGPTQIDRRDRQRSVFVTASLDGRALGDVSAEIQREIDTIAVPQGYKISQGGAAEDQAESFMQIFQALGLSVLLMYMLMVALFESLLFPFIIMLSLPLAVVGAFGLLAITGNTLNMMSMIGMILLTGLVGKNAILLVDYTNTLRREGVPRNEALLRAGPTRLRPILMTTAALVLAMMPIAMKLHEGSEWRAPMAITVIGGLITSTLLTLVLIPSVYTIMDDFSGLLRRVPSLVRRVARRPVRTQIEERERLRAPIPVRVPVSGGSE